MIKNIISNLIYKGIDREHRTPNTKITITTNFILLAAALVAFARCCTFFITLDYNYSLVSLLSTIAFILVYYSNTKGYHSFAKFSLLLIGNLATGYKEMASGGNAGQIYLILASFGVVFLLFNVKEYNKIIIGLSIPLTNTLLNLFFPNLFFPPHLVSQDVLNQEKFIGIFSNIAISVMIIWYFVKQSDDIELQLKETNLLIELKNKELESEIELKYKAQKEAEKANILLEISLEKEVKLNHFRSDLIATVSHEYRNPLSIIQLSSDLLQKYYKDRNDTKFEDNISKLKKSVYYLTDGLSNLLNYSKMENDEIILNLFDDKLDELMIPIIQTQLNLDNANLHNIIYKNPNKNLKIKTDPNLFHQIVQNLLFNAIKYSPNGGDVVIEVSELEDKFNISITDNGIAIAAEDIPLLTIAFKRGKNVQNIKGTGLGLAIVKAWIDKLGGSFEISSTIGIGSVFSITLPKSYS